jgi:NhaA family Na+:H+ antiporter
MLWANSPWRESYYALLELTFGPAALDLHIDVRHWAGDGLLAIFFFVAGLELKRELVVGELRKPAQPAIPVVAAVCGVVVPALVYLAVTAGEPGAFEGWAVPVATDIAFALAVLAVLGSFLPTALRTFLLTLAVVDDLVAITIIAIFYTRDLEPLLVLAALVPLVAFAFVVRRRPLAWWALLPLAGATWTLVHASGVHATVAGVLLAFTVPVRPVPGARGLEPGHSPAEHLEHVVRPLSAGVAVPVFALTAAGVTVVDGGMGAALADPVFAGIVAGLVLGKAIGVFGGTYIMARFTKAELDEGLTWGDVVGVSLLAGIGFTVSLLIGELAFGIGSEREDHVKLAVLAGSLLSAALASAVLLRRNAVYRRMAEEGRAAEAAG